MPQFLCPTCGARLYSASQLTKCAWCGTQLSSDEVEEPEQHRDDPESEESD